MWLPNIVKTTCVNIHDRSCIHTNIFFSFKIKGTPMVESLQFHRIEIITFRPKNNSIRCPYSLWRNTQLSNYSFEQCTLHSTIPTRHKAAHLLVYARAAAVMRSCMFWQTARTKSKRKTYMLYTNILYITVNAFYASTYIFSRREQVVYIYISLG